MNMQFTLILCVYNCKVSDLEFTLNSCLKQENIEFEIIIADDCSKETYCDFVDDYMKMNNFSNYIYQRNEINVGTVKNILYATRKSKGEIIKAIGAGDAFYDKYSLINMYDFMLSNNFKIAFGDIKAYKKVEEQLYVSDFSAPFIKKCYKKQNYKEIKNNLIVFGDQISGAGLFFEKEILEYYLKLIEDKIIYVEDYIPRLMALDNVYLGYLNKNLILYQFGTGISTKKTKTNNDRIIKDFEGFNSLIKIYKNDKLVKKYLNTIEYYKLTVIKKFIKKFVSNPYFIIFSFKAILPKYKRFRFWKKLNER